ncbi:tetratricopeptide repeat protein [Dongia rigui]|uniref:Tetratricopeptide repeat protein n=1 Tax=Dongia rigui TaxID=940149 RepID=A0ABU5E5W6_9PROT|nr:tetratricopeptide repeat protein [Dongia rigui]MDY0874276.1 tetratricopeptide repeat protein [Dongia rigui]
MIRITRNLMVGGCLRLAISVGAVAMAALPAWADYQSGVDAYYKGDFRAAYDAWLPLAEAGDAVAQNSLGALYDHGLGVSEDNAEAARWYEMAAQQGLPLAMRNLGNQYATGHGVTYDINLAQQWYEKAAALGDQQSAALLAHLRPATTPPVDTTATAALPAFSAPTTTGNLAEPIEGSTAATQSADAPDAGDSTLVIPDAPAAAPVPVAPSSDAPIALDLGGNTLTMPATSEPATPAPAPAAPATVAQAAPAPVQQASVTPIQPTVPRADGNWLIGQWQGPSLGCPKGGGIEFTDGETLSWFDGQVAVRLAATYQVSGDNIVVNATGSDGTPQQYTYQRSGPDKMIIVNIPQSMPKSLLGIAYRRCGSAPSVTQSAAAAPAPATPATMPIIGGGTGEAPVLPASTQPATPAVPDVAATTAVPAPAAPATTPAPAPAANATGTASQYSLNEQANLGKGAAASDEKVASGWAAFEQGNYQEALTIFKSQAEAGNTNMQVLVGNMYDYGQGVPQDDVQALQWYLMAASKGDIKGQYQAANLYFSSPTVPKNNIEAYRWASLAAKGPAGDRTAIWSQQMLSVLTANMTEDEIDEAKSLAKKPLQTN